MSLAGLISSSLISRVRSWRVAVLLDDEDLVVLGDEGGDVVVEREAADPQQVERHALLGQQLDRLVHRRRGGAVIDRAEPGGLAGVAADRARGTRLRAVANFLSSRSMLSW